MHRAWRLVEAADPVVQPVLLVLKKGGRDYPLYQDVRRFVTDALDGFSLEARRQRVRDEDIETARYALVAFVDEMILNSGWSGKEQWQKASLQVEIFKRATAGDEFFDTLLTLTDSQRPVLEVYFLCLALGFEGKYRDAGPDRQRELRGILESLRRRIAGAGPDLEVPFFESAYERLRPVEVAERVRGRMWLAIGAGALLVFAVAWIVYWSLVQQATGAAVRAIGG